MIATAREYDADVIVVGGGPVGLLAAILLADRGVRVTVLEKRTGPTTRTMAIGITPPSLEIMRGINLDAGFVSSGVCVRTAVVHEAGRPVGRITFDAIASDYPFVLSIPQPVTVGLLLGAAAKRPGLRLLQGVEFTGLEQTSDDVTVKARHSDGGDALQLRARLVIGCDGIGSAVRAACGIAVDQKRYGQRFVMADFEDRSGLADECHLFFSATESVESFPLPEGRRRWIVLVPGDDPAKPAEHIVQRVRELAGYDLAGGPASHVSAFGARWMLARTYSAGRVVLAGDAAHCMSSVGGQGMNTGFADAELAVIAIDRALADPAHKGEAFAAYEAIRKQAFRVAARRAETGMWLGTKRGRLSSVLRRQFIGNVLFGPLLRHRLPPHFAMLTIPHNNLARHPELLERVER